ncbi:tyrosine-type recombinase/integrase, partial [Pontibacterium sp.]|uniref:tyrosine-type recombinase/integrase n=1 Tax=Pontibacterium sp. TaxID=2036026 RepID=UPI003566354A
DHSKIEKHFIPFFKEQKKLNALTEQDIQAYLEKLARTELGKSTQDRHIALLKAFEKYAMERQWINASFMGSIKMNNPKNGRTRFLSDEELGRFHVACRCHEGDVYRAFEFIASLGLRISEALNARLENWDPASNTLYLEDSKTGARFVTLNPSATAILEQQAQKYSHDGLVFRGRNDDRPMSYPAKAWKKIMVDADLNDGTVTPHCLRHTYCSHLLMNGIDQFSVSRLMGLSSTHCIHRHYGHLSNKTLTAANAVVTDVINQSVKKVQVNEAA